MYLSRTHVITKNKTDCFEINKAAHHLFPAYIYSYNVYEYISSLYYTHNAIKAFINQLINHEI